MTLLGKKGMPTATKTFLTTFGTGLETKRSFKAYQYNYNSGEFSDEIELPKGTSLALVAYYPEQALVQFKVLSLDPSAEDVYIACSYKSDYPGTVSGVTCDELFYRVNFGG